MKNADRKMPEIWLENARSSNENYDYRSPNYMNGRSRRLIFNLQSQENITRRYTEAARRRHKFLLERVILKHIAKRRKERSSEYDEYNHCRNRNKATAQDKRQKIHQRCLAASCLLHVFKADNNQNNRPDPANPASADRDNRKNRRAYAISQSAKCGLKITLCPSEYQKYKMIYSAQYKQPCNYENWRENHVDYRGAGLQTEA